MGALKTENYDHVLAGGVGCLKGAAESASKGGEKRSVKGNKPASVKSVEDPNNRVAQWVILRGEQDGSDDASLMKKKVGGYAKRKKGRPRKSSLDLREI